MSWIDVADHAAVAAAGRMVVRADGQQILLIETERGLVATANRCPHEGYPLSEGSLAGCTLTCNWHNWKFDLASGETLVGGDRLRRYPHRIEDGRIWLELAEPPIEERRAALLDGLIQALQDRDQQRLVREAARLGRLGAAPEVSVATAVTWAHDRLEYGTTHAFAAIPDWLRLVGDPGLEPAARLMALGEILCHIADDVAGADARFGFSTTALPWDAEAFGATVEREDETAAVGLLRGALAQLTWPADLKPALLGAALAHYADFGHALIYTVQAFRLIERIGPRVATPLLLALTRSLIFGQREDLLPEFRDYRPRLDAWWQSAAEAPAFDATVFRRTSARSAMATVAAWAPSRPPGEIFAVLVEAAAWQLLHADEPFMDSVDQKLSENVSWLDFTHGLTFAAAGREAVAADPSLWPALLLQLACFVGRGSGYVDAELAVDAWAVSDRDAFLARAIHDLVRHGYGRFIHSAHLAKTLFAAVELADALPTAAPTILAAVNRYLQASQRGRNPLRVARQMLGFVAEE